MPSKILVLCVDRDDDLGAKTQIKGPIIGKEENIKAAQALILADPAESDANAIFEGVRIFSEIKDAVEVVTLTGHRRRGYKADKIIAKQLEEVLKKYDKVDGVYLVTDGADDEELIPVIQSQIKIVSKKTLIIRQAKELEKSYYVIKEVLRDPHFARIIFGLPGIILLTVAFLQELGFQIIILLIGIYLMFKGFGLEDPLLNALRGFRETTSIERASFPLYIGSVLTFILAIWSGLEKLSAVEGEVLLTQGAAFVEGAIGLFIISIVLFLMGRIGDMHYRQEVLKIRKYAMSIVTVLAVWLVIAKAMEFVFYHLLLDEFLLYIGLAFLLSIVGISLVRRLYLSKYVVARLKKNLDVYDINGNMIGTLREISRKDRKIQVDGEKEKFKVPFSRIILVKDFVAVRL
jgi:putative membrane protein